MRFVCRSHENIEQEKENEPQAKMSEMKTTLWFNVIKWFGHWKLTSLEDYKGKAPFDMCKIVQSFVVWSLFRFESNALMHKHEQNTSIQMFWMHCDRYAIFVFRTHLNTIEVKCFAFIYNTIWNSNHYCSKWNAIVAAAAVAVVVSIAIRLLSMW